MILPEFFQRFVWIPLRILLITFCALEIRGIENVKNAKGNIIIASNHLSEMDPLLIVSILPFFSRHIPLIYVSRQKYNNLDIGWKKLLYGGIFFKMIGAYPSYTGLKDYHKALPHHLKIAKKGKNIAIFPYGGIIRDGEPKKAKGGVSFLSHKTNLPIMPLLIKGTKNFTLRNILSGSNKVAFTFGSPLYPKDIFRNHKKIVLNDNQNDYALAAEVIMERVEKLA